MKKNKNNFFHKSVDKSIRVYYNSIKDKTKELAAMMEEKIAMEVLNGAMGRFDGIRLFLDEHVEDFGFIMHWDLYPEEEGIEIWSCDRSDKLGSTWSIAEYRHLIKWEDVPREYRKELDAK